VLRRNSEWAEGSRSRSWRAVGFEREMTPLPAGVRMLKQPALESRCRGVSSRVARSSRVASRDSAGGLLNCDGGRVVGRVAQEHRGAS